jgi:uncharacterized protein with PQ loop repeat
MGTGVTSPPATWLTAAVILVALVVGIGFVLQALRLARYGVGGFSGGSWVLLLIVIPTWFGYGIRHGDTGVVVANAILLLPTIAVVATWARRAGSVLGKPLVLLGLVSAPVAASMVLPLALVGTIALVVDTGTAWPQAVRAVRSPTVVGVSIPAWTFRASTLVLWTWYGLAAGLPLLAAASANKLIASLTIALSVALKRRREPPLIATPATA